MKAPLSPEPELYPMAPLIRGTLVSLYLALVLPLPLLAPSGAMRGAVVMAVAAGLVLVLAITSERVQLDGHGLQVTLAPWCQPWLRRGWRLPWADVCDLTAVATSQGGRVFYVRSRQGGAMLLPQRVARLESFLERFSTATGVNTAAVGRISPPWTYQLLALLSGLMLAAELVTLMLQRG
ncbi:MAG: hypothetical protein VKN13_00455 [Cyanobacteriota bacterium]|nr:hypothetical protein [Cyanobacteriota bacterium]